MRMHTATLYTLAAIMLAGCSQSTNPSTAQPVPSTQASPTSIPAAQPAALGVEGTVDTIPWSQVGPGWVLATWSPYVGHRAGEVIPNQPDPDTVTTTLYLVDPQGGRYPITTFPPTKGMAAPDLIDWSGDGSRALFDTVGQPTSVTEIDLHTGKQRTIPLADPSADARYTLPEGKALLLTTGGYHETASLTRVDLTGKQQLAYPVGQDFGGVLSRPDGTELVVGTGTGLASMGNDGTRGEALPVAGQEDCSPLRWWDANATVTLATCGSQPSQLWLVPIDGSTPTALTAPNGHQTGVDLGDTDAWQLPAGTFVQSLGACGVSYLAKLNPDGTTTQVDVPDVQGGTIEVVGVNGDSLRLHAKAACGGGLEIVDYNPTTNTTTTLLGGPMNGGGVIDAIPFKGQQ